MAEGGVDPPGAQAKPRETVPFVDCEPCDDWELNLQEQRDEIMALESIFGEPGPIQIVSRPDEDGKGVFSLEIEITVPLSEEGVMVEIWVPYELNNALPTAPAMAKMPIHNRPNFMRSESGRQWHSAFPVHHLTPLSLFVTLPQNYPSDVAPVFTLSCVWLDAGQLSDLCEQLDQRWIESLGMPVIYTWIDWLQSSSLSHLCLEKTVILSPHVDGDVTSVVPRDPRALPECVEVGEDLVKLIENDCRKQWEEFVRGEHECSICFCEYPGTQFYVIDECRHRCCRDCMADYCIMHVTDGTVQQLKCCAIRSNSRCPQTECKLLVPPAILQDVLGADAYVRWERLCLQKALETMDDVTWCPRCNSAVIRDSDETQAYCVNCMYSFCPRCNEPYHAKSPCLSVDDQLRRIERETKRLAEELGTDIDDVKGMTKEDMQRISMAKLARLKAEFLSKSYLKKAAKKCPKCHIPIEKNGGCNKVCCTQCGASMCWICGKAIKGYEHFNDNGARCDLFPGQNPAGIEWRARLDNRPRPEGADAVERAEMAGVAAVIARCPRCRQRNLRNGTNNHIKCWACKVNSCFQCKQVITGTVSSHYIATMPCLQHGDP